jgi:ABC-type dipeptide/oligopeptide/nickel transport system permease subunit
VEAREPYLSFRGKASSGERDNMHISSQIWLILLPLIAVIAFAAGWYLLDTIERKE